MDEMSIPYRIIVAVRPSPSRIGFALLLVGMGMWNTTETLADTSPGYHYRYVSRAVDANRKAHFALDYGRKPPPWADDLIHRVTPTYPYEDRSMHREGDGLYR